MADRNATSKDQRRCAMHFLKMAGAATALAAALAALVWYGEGRRERLPDSFLSPPFVSTLNHRDPAGFVRQLDQLPSINTPDAEGVTPLLAVVACGNEDECAQLLARGADVNVCQYG